MGGGVDSADALVQTLFTGRLVSFAVGVNRHIPFVDPLSQLREQQLGPIQQGDEVLTFHGRRSFVGAPLLQHLVVELIPGIDLLTLVELTKHTKVEQTLMLKGSLPASASESNTSRRLAPELK